VAFGSPIKSSMAEAKKDGEVKEKKPLNIKLILGIVGAVVNLGVLGGGAFLTYSNTIAYHHPQVTEEHLAQQADEEGVENQLDTPLIYTMDKFTTNLEGDPKRTLRVEINLSMLSRDGFEEVMRYDQNAKARDKILQILNTKGYTDLESIQGKLFLKDQIAGEINELLLDGVVKDVFFSEFVAQ
jgi:flagellar protein FliL